MLVKQTRRRDRARTGGLGGFQFGASKNLGPVYQPGRGQQAGCEIHCIMTQGAASWSACLIQNLPTCPVRCGARASEAPWSPHRSVYLYVYR